MLILPTNDEMKLIEDNFDDFELDIEHGVWSQVCPEHKEFASKFGQVQDEGSGMCGVKGCESESSHYVDFGYK